MNGCLNCLQKMAECKDCRNDFYLENLRKAKFVLKVWNQGVIRLRGYGMTFRGYLTGGRPICLERLSISSALSLSGAMKTEGAQMPPLCPDSEGLTDGN